MCTDPERSAEDSSCEMFLLVLHEGISNYVNLIIKYNMIINLSFIHLRGRHFSNVATSKKGQVSVSTL